MANYDEQIYQRLELLRQEIVTSIESHGITASGRTQRSLEVVKYDNGVKLIAAAGDRAPLDTLEIGRDGGKVPRHFTDILEQWSRDKGIGFSSDRERRTFAYLLGRRIAEKGTLRHYKHVDVYSTAVEQAVEDIKNLIIAGVNDVIKTNF